MWTERPAAPGIITVQIHKERLQWLLTKADSLNIEYSTLHEDLQQEIDRVFQLNKIAKVSSKYLLENILRLLNK